MDVVELVKKPDMYTSYWLDFDSVEPRLFKRTFAVVETEWEHVKLLTDEEVEAVQKEGIKEWK